MGLGCLLRGCVCQPTAGRRSASAARSLRGLIAAPPTTSCTLPAHLPARLTATCICICTCIFLQGVVKEPHFRKFRSETSATEAAARKFLSDAGVAHYWELAAAYQTN